MHILVRLILTLSLVWAASTANAQFNGCPPGFCNLSSSSGPPVTGFLLIDTGSVLLVDTGSSFLVN